MKVNIEGLKWISDWNGEDIGHDEYIGVGLYVSDYLMCDFYMDIETSVVLEVIPHGD